MSIKIIETYDGFEIDFPFNPVIYKSVKAMQGARYRVDGSRKYWIVPAGQAAAVNAFRMRYGIQKIETIAPEKIDALQELPELTIDIPLRMDMFPFQKKGVAYALEKKKLIIGDQPGLGKTIQAIATIMAANAFPALIICPSSLKLNWQREWDMWTGKQALIMTDRVKSTWKEFLRVGATKILITNYESLKKYFVHEIKQPPGTPLRLNHIHFHEAIKLFKSVIIDESHRVKEPKTQQTKFVKGIASSKEYILALTGTPVVNKPRDLASQLGIIESLNHFGGYKTFINRYCEGYNGASNLRELNSKLTNNCFYRREKKDVLKELPDKMRSIVLCDISTRKEYADALESLENYLREYKNANDEKVASAIRGEIMVKIGVLKNISARGKLADVIDWVRDITEQGEKIVLFTHLREVSGALKEQFKDALTVLGEDHTHTRQHNIDAFQNNPARKIIICSIKAAGVGITLTAASRVAFVELPWHPADCDQCEDRCHRIGQHDSVQCFYFLGKDTIDEKIYKLIEKKRAISDAVTGSTESIESEIIDIMMGSLFNKKSNGKDIISDSASIQSGPDESRGEAGASTQRGAEGALASKDLFSAADSGESF